MTTSRSFEIKDAVRESVPLLIGLVGPSGSGKTGSALELAHGIQQVVGGEIGYIDTESNRAKHYAKAAMFSDKSKTFQFKHLSFGAPFNPNGYKAAIEAMIKTGVKTVVVDSMSHEHEGPGGVLEMHEKNLDKLAGDDWGKRDKMTFLAWAAPKAERRALINFLLQQPVNFIFCFRAKEKMKILKNAEGKNVPVQQGWQPIAGEEFVFEMTLNCLLLPGANGVPTWNPDEKGERQMIKLPEQFKAICTPNRALSAAMGKELALWAKGGEASPVPESPKKPAPKPNPVADSLPTTPKAEPQDRLTETLDLIRTATAEDLKYMVPDFNAHKAEYGEDWSKVKAAVIARKKEVGG
jgi:energy-coupling factor transporter ATP-binding protein EcfA2